MTGDFWGKKKFPIAAAPHPFLETWHKAFVGEKVSSRAGWVIVE